MVIMVAVGHMGVVESIGNRVCGAGATMPDFIVDISLSRLLYESVRRRTESLRTMYRLFDASNATPIGFARGILSGVLPTTPLTPEPARVRTHPYVSITRIRLLPVSATNIFPYVSMAMPDGRLNRAVPTPAVSSENPGEPMVPAITELVESGLIFDMM